MRRAPRLSDAPASWRARAADYCVGIVPAYVAPAARLFDELTPEEQLERREFARAQLAQARLPVDQVQA